MAFGTLVPGHPISLPGWLDATKRNVERHKSDGGRIVGCKATDSSSSSGTFGRFSVPVSWGTAARVRGRLPKSARCLIPCSNDDHPDAEFKSPKMSWRGDELDGLSSVAKISFFPNSPSQRWNIGTGIVARNRFGLFEAGSSIDSA